LQESGFSGLQSATPSTVKLVPFSNQYLSLDEPLPFGVRDAAGRLLLGAGLMVQDAHQLAELAGQALFADESESADWHRRLNAAMDVAIRQGVALRHVADARPDNHVREAAQAPAASLPEQWHEMVSQLDAALRDVRAGSDWRARLLAVHVRARQLFQRRPDASLYHLVYEAGHSTAKYCSHHALLTLLISEQAAAMLGWPAAWQDSLGRAALTMNVAIQRLQDLLAESHRAPKPEMRTELQAHPETGAALLQAAGFGDPLCLAVVRLHHDNSQADKPLSTLPPEHQLARLLRRVDIFAAKISRRALRSPMSPVQAAREACLGKNDVPDEIGGALLKAVGLYPPGSFVELVTGELSIVLARGRRANLPYVATLVAPNGDALGTPLLRDTFDQRYKVKAALAPSQVKVRPPHERLLAMR
jgi:HD-GYP domain-containing protein (c-di-GMP phosphodiesterase class II)